MSTEARVCFDEVGERSVELRVGDFVDVDIEPFEDGLVELTANRVAGAEVELPRVLQQFDCGVDVVQHGSELVLGAFLAFGETLACGRDVVEPFPDRLFWQLSVLGEVKQVLVFDVETTQFLGELGVEFSCGLLVVLDSALDAGADVRHEFGGEAERCPVAFDGLFDARHLGVSAVAEAFLRLSAKEVLIHLITAALDVGEHHPPGPFLFVAVAAEEAAFEVVLVDSLPFSGGAAGDDLLHPRE